MQLADGWGGTDATVAKATQLVRDSLTDPVVRLTAESLVRHLPERDKGAEIRAVSQFVRGKIRYTNEGVETIKSPRLLLDEIRTYGKAVGDCDDHVILWLALHKVLGQKVRIRVVSQRDDGVATHIFGEVYDPHQNRWITDDTIKKDRKIGWEVPREKRTADKIYNDGMGDHGMPGYQTVSQSGTWHPGGAGRFYVNPQQRPGISVHQLALGRNLLPRNIQLRGASDLEDQGVGATITASLPQTTVPAAGAQDGFASILSSIGPLIQSAAKGYGEYKAAKKAAKAGDKAMTAVPQAPPPTYYAPAPRAGGFIQENWQMLALAGGALALILAMRR